MRSWKKEKRLRDLNDNSPMHWCFGSHHQVWLLICIRFWLKLIFGVLVCILIVLIGKGIC